MDDSESIHKRLYQEYSIQQRESGDAIDDLPLTCCSYYSVTTPYQTHFMYSIVHRLNGSCTHIVRLLTILVMIGFVNTANTAAENQNSLSSSRRGGKALFFEDPLNDLFFNNQYQNEDLLGNTEEYDGAEDEVMSRAKPVNKKKYADSPIYYIRIPPTPYVHVPGYGYISEPQSLKPPPQVVNKNKYSNSGYNQNFQRPAPSYSMPSFSMPTFSMPSYVQPQHNYNYNNQGNFFNSYQNALSSLNYQGDEYSNPGVYPANTFPLSNQGFQSSNSAHNKYQDSPIYNVPLQFLSNGKPHKIYSLENEIQAAPAKPTKPAQPDSPIYNLDKGPYVFNGKPADAISLLRRAAYNEAYNELYDDTINNFFP